MVKAGILTAKAKAKASADGSYLPLAQYPEFTEAVEEQLVKQTASARQRDMKSLYQQVEKDQSRLKRWRWITSKIRGAVGFGSLVIFLSIVGVLVWVLFTYGVEVFNWLGSKTMELMNE